LPYNDLHNILPLNDLPKFTYVFSQEEARFFNFHALVSDFFLGSCFFARGDRLSFLLFFYSLIIFWIVGFVTEQENVCERRVGLPPPLIFCNSGRDNVLLFCFTLLSLLFRRYRFAQEHPCFYALPILFLSISRYKQSHTHADKQDGNSNDDPVFSLSHFHPVK